MHHRGQPLSSLATRSTNFINFQKHAFGSSTPTSSGLLAASSSASPSTTPRFTASSPINLATLASLPDSITHLNLDSPTLQESNDTARFITGAKNEDPFTVMLRKKNLALNTFDPCGIQLHDPMSKHTQWIFEHILSVPYRNTVKHDIARHYHGLRHAMRVSLNAMIFANLYKKHHYSDAMNLTNEDARLLQLAALFHDTGREAEGFDYWDKDSAELFYHYVTRVLRANVSRDKLIQITEAIANKGYCPGGTTPDSTAIYHRLNINEHGELSWDSNPPFPAKKSIFAMIIHDADCEDIQRQALRSVFDATYLDFYQYIAQNNEAALDDLSRTRVESRSLSTLHGDGAIEDVEVQKKYECKEGFLHVLSSIRPDVHPLTHRLHNHLLSTTNLKQSSLGKSSTGEKNEKTRLTVEQLRAGNTNTVRYFIRSIHDPSAIRNKPSRPPESMAALEVRKAARRPYKPTRSKKANKIKNGNPNRCVTVLGKTFGSSGYIVKNTDMKDIRYATERNAGSGMGKRHNVSVQSTTGSVTGDLNQIYRKEKLGGSDTNTEIAIDIYDFDGVFFTQEPNRFSTVVHQYAPALQAVYLQKTYEKEHKTTLPLFEYSATHNYWREFKFSDDDLVMMWRDACKSYLEKNADDDTKFNQTVDEIKIHSIYDVPCSFTIRRAAATHYQPADEIYSDELKQRITQEIQHIRKEIIDKREAPLFKAIAAGQLFSPEIDAALDRRPSTQFVITLTRAVNDRLKTCTQNAKLYTPFKDLFKLANRLGLQEKAKAASSIYFDNLVQEHLDHHSNSWDSFASLVDHAQQCDILHDPQYIERIKLIIARKANIRLTSDMAWMKDTKPSLLEQLELSILLKIKPTGNSLRSKLASYNSLIDVFIAHTPHPLTNTETDIISETVNNMMSEFKAEEIPSNELEKVLNRSPSTQLVTTLTSRVNARLESFIKLDTSNFPEFDDLYKLANRLGLHEKATEAACVHFENSGRLHLDVHLTDWYAFNILLKKADQYHIFNEQRFINYIKSLIARKPDIQNRMNLDWATETIIYTDLLPVVKEPILLKLKPTGNSLVSQLGSYISLVNLLEQRTTPYTAAQSTIISEKINAIINEFKNEKTPFNELAGCVQLHNNHLRHYPIIHLLLRAAYNRLAPIERYSYATMESINNLTSLGITGIDADIRETEAREIHLTKDIQPLRTQQTDYINLRPELLKELKSEEHKKLSLFDTLFSQFYQLNEIDLRPRDIEKQYKLSNNFSSFFKTPSLQRNLTMSKDSTPPAHPHHPQLVRLTQ